MTLVGHATEVAAFVDAMAGGRMHHAWLLAGPPGVGKATFAEAAAARLLADAAGPPATQPGLSPPPDHPTMRLIAAGSHPDLRRLARMPREKGEGTARSITVDQIRSLGPMFATTPSLSQRRVVIVDAVDDLERGGANALLKNLEEPPKGTIFLLVSHAPGRLLPTVRSRCRTLRFGPLGDADVRLVLGRALPDLGEHEADALIAVAEGAPGRAIGFAGLDVAAIDRVIADLTVEGDRFGTRTAALAKALAPRAAQPRFDLFLDRATRAMAAAARTRDGALLAEAVLLWERGRGLADSARALSLDPQAVVFELAGLLASLSPSHLKKA